MSGARHPRQERMRLPREGTAIRRVFDLLCAGATVPVSRMSSNNQALEQLRSFYDCEIVSGPAGSRMLGRWDGPYFVPVERLYQGLDR
jgi:hypothetical protein